MTAKARRGTGAFLSTASLGGSWSAMMLKRALAGMRPEDLRMRAALRISTGLRGASGFAAFAGAAQKHAPTAPAMANSNRTLGALDSERHGVFAGLFRGQRNLECAFVLRKRE